MPILPPFELPIRLETLPEQRTPPSPTAPRKWQEAPLYVPSDGLSDAINLAIALRQPLLLTGPPGCGKTTAAYWAAWRLGLGPDDLIHAQVQSSTTAARFRYHFDVVRYFGDTQLATLQKLPLPGVGEAREQYIEKGPLWQAFLRARQRPVVLLLDEIDKAPRDFPNDLLHDFEALGFDVPEWPVGDGKVKRIEAPREQAGGKLEPEQPGLRLLICTSNAERSLPGAFLRRCVHHHLAFDREWLRKIVDDLFERGELRISETLKDVALRRFLQLRGMPGLSHPPGHAECLVWLRVLEALEGYPPDRLERVALRQLPYLGVLLKEPTDLEVLGKAG